MNRITQNLNIIAVPLFFILLALVGLVIYQDYGYSWDEGIQRAIGLHTYNYVLHDSQELFSHPGQYYGSFFEFGLIGAERILNLTSTQDIYFMRHLVNFSFFFAAIFVFYRIAKKRFDNHWISLLGVSFLVLSPRIFADGFYNSKDIILLSLFIFAFYFIIKFFEQPSWLNIILLSFFSALVIDLRLIGLLVPVIVVLMASMFIILVDSWSINWKQILFYIFVYGVLTIVFVYILWPYLWPDPIGNFLESLRITGNYSPQANMKIFYLGSYTTADSLPAHYIFLWLLITTPVSYTALFMFGLNAYRTRVVDLMNLQKSKTDLIFLLWFFLPLLALIILKPIIYVGWRHFYFIYPAFILIALVGLHTLSQYINNKIHSPNFQRIVLSLVSVLLLVNTFSVGLFMYKNHPYQNVYLNYFSKKYVFQPSFWRN